MNDTANDKAPQTNRPPPGAHVIHARKGGNDAVKWLAGAAAAVLLVGGGYYAWSHRAPSEPGADYAQNEAAPISESEGQGFASNTPSESATPAAPSESATPAAPIESDDASSTETQTAAAPARRATATRSSQRARANDVPEEVIGVTPVSATSSDSADAGELVIHGARRPVWSRTPSAYRLSTYYPERALERGREGEASIHCTVQDSGALDCVRVSETPVNSGFGNAALRVARTFRHAPQLADGAAAAGTPVNLRVVFRMAEERRRG